MKTVIEMAREADKPEETCWLTYEIDFLERFAELVRKDYSFTHAQMWLKRFDDAIIAEREACAKVCESLWRIDGQFTADEFAAEVRARSNT